MTPRILVIAGSDSGGGAGIQADIKTISALGGHAMTAITAITAQNTLGVTDVMPVPADMVLSQMEDVMIDIGFDAVKIGMLSSAEIARSVAIQLGPYREPIVVDPVMVATSGAVLADEETIRTMQRLARMATIVTPNLPELTTLCGKDGIHPDRVEDEAALYARSIGAAVLVKGGHGEGDTIIDRLIDADGAVTRWVNPRIETRHTHGTGCTLSSAIAVGLARRSPLVEVVGHAIDFVRASLVAAPGLGRGAGPMGQQFVCGAACCPA